MWLTFYILDSVIRNCKATTKKKNKKKAKVIANY